MTFFSEPRLLNSPRWKNMRVGLLGGSFNPPHDGHVHIAKTALSAFHLDVIWVLVTPQNPLKDTKETVCYEERIQLTKDLMKHPKLIVTGLEKQLSTPYSSAMIKALKKYYPYTDFLWITGMDNAHNLHLWENWKNLLSHVCVAHIARPPVTSLVRNCPARMLSTQRQVVLDRGACVPLDSHTTYWLMQRKMLDISSTGIRRKNNRL